MILIDTSVLVYAVGEEHPLRESCRALLAAHAEGRLDLTTTIETVQVFAHVRARRRSRSDATALARDIIHAFEPLATTIDDLDRGLDLFMTIPELGAFDAVLAAVALGRRADALVSADRAFGAVPGLRWLDPGGVECRTLTSGVSSP